MNKNIRICSIIVLAFLLISCKEDSKVQKQLDNDSLSGKSYTQNQIISDSHSNDITKLKNINKEFFSEIIERDKDNPLIGTPVSLRQLLFEQPFDIPRNEALDMAERGHPFVLLVNDKDKNIVFYVFNQKAEFMGKELAKYCGKTIKLTGKSFLGRELNLFFVDKIMDN